MNGLQPERAPLSAAAITMVGPPNILWKNSCAARAPSGARPSNRTFGVTGLRGGSGPADGCRQINPLLDFSKVAPPHGEHARQTQDPPRSHTSRQHPAKKPNFLGQHTYLVDNWPIPMSQVPENFCIVPFTSMTVRADGSCAACCMNTLTARNDGEEKLFVYESGLMDAFVSPPFVELRQSLRRNERHPSCSACWKQEDAGVHSMRQQENNKFRHLLANHVEGNLPTRPIDLSLNLGNLCNLKCRICSSFSSSKWVPEQEQLWGEDYLPRESSTMRSLSKEESRSFYTNWPYRSAEFSETFYELLPRIERLEFLGGESLLNKKQFEITRRAVELGCAKDQEIRFVTNTTQFPEEVVNEIWSQFKAVQVNFSVDGLGKQFEYQRHGADWDKALANIGKFRSSPHVDHVRIYVSISVFTIYYLPEILTYWHGQGLPVQFSFVQVPVYLDIRTIPDRLKLRIARHYESRRASVPKEMWPKLDEVLHVMGSGDLSREWLKFVEVTWHTDKHRGQSFANTFPEFWRIAKSEGFWPDYHWEFHLFQTPEGVHPLAALPPPTFFNNLLRQCLIWQQQTSGMHGKLYYRSRWICLHWIPWFWANWLVWSYRIAKGEFFRYLFRAIRAIRHYLEHAYFWLLKTSAISFFTARAMVRQAAHFTWWLLHGKVYCRSRWIWAYWIPWFWANGLVWSYRIAKGEFFRYLFRAIRASQRLLGRAQVPANTKPPPRA